MTAHDAPHDPPRSAPRDQVPATWLTSHRHLLPASGDALDLACGRGRNALWLAQQGFRVQAIDRDDVALAALRDEAAARGLPIETRVCDLESGEPVLAPRTFDVIVVVHYLHRPLIPHLMAALRPGGVLVYETFTAAQALRGKPSNPAFLLQPGELVARVTAQWFPERWLTERRLTEWQPGQAIAAPLEVLAAREGDFDGRMVSSVVARRA
jgi:SAM-dependent methyltransferase